MYFDRIRSLRRERARRQRVKALARAFDDPSRDIVHLQFETPTIGMFAQLSACIKVAEVAERRGKRPVMRLVSENYLEPGDDPDWFNTYFVNQAAADLPDDLQPTVMMDGNELPDRLAYETLGEVKGLFTRNYGVRAEIEAEVDAFAEAHAIGAHTLALHYRGTDKHKEAPAQAAQDVLDRVARYIDTQEGVENVFISSDEAAFVEKASAGLAGLPVIAMDDSFRSTGDTPVHLQGVRQGNRAMGLDAVRNCLMLAKGGWLCRTSSFLSAWSAVFNPDIKIAVFNVPYEETTWRLESLILRDAQRI